MIEWKQYGNEWHGELGGETIIEIYGHPRSYMSFMTIEQGDYETIDQAKAKSEELLTEWLTTASLIRLDSIYRCPDCGDGGERYIDQKLTDCDCLKNPNSIASIKRGARR